MNKGRYKSKKYRSPEEEELIYDDFYDAVEYVAEGYLGTRDEDHFSFKRRKKKGRGGLFRRIAKKIGDGVKKVGKFLGKLAAYSALVPMMPVMAAGLKKKGIKPRLRVDKMTKQFYKAFLNKSYDEYAITPDSEHFVDAIASVVKAVINFVKKLIQKKKAGKAMDSADNAMLQKGVQISDAMTRSAEAGIIREQETALRSGGGALSEGGNKKMMTYVAIGIGVLALAYVVMNK